MKRIVYRLETDNGGGPYRGDNYVGFCMTHHTPPGSQGLDTKTMDYVEYRCTVEGWVFAWLEATSMASYVIYSDIPEVIANGFKVSVYEIDEEFTFVFPDNQVCFDRPRATLIGRVDYNDFRRTPIA